MAICLAAFCWLINYVSWMSVNYAANFRYVQKIKHCLCLMPFSVFIYGKFNSNYYVYFYLFLVFKCNKSGTQIIHLILDHLIFLGCVDIGGYLVMVIFWKMKFNSWSFFRCFFLTYKLCVSGLYIMPYFGHGQCSTWWFLVLAFTKSASLTTIFFFQQFFMIWKWYSSSL